MKYYAHTTDDDDTRNSWQPLETHLKAVGIDSGLFAGAVGLSSAGTLMGLLHDVGKYTRQFQRYLDKEEATGGDHSSAGAQWLWNEFRQYGPFGVLCGQILALGVCSHHSVLSDCLSMDGETDLFTQRMGKAANLAEVMSSLDGEILSSVMPLFSKKSVAELKAHLFSIKAGNDTRGLATGAAALCDACPDKIRRSCAARDPITAFQFGLVVRFLYSCLIDADRIDAASVGHSKPSDEPHRSYVGWSILSHRMETYLSGLKERFSIDGIRHRVSGFCRERAGDPKGLFSLTVPTGGGKTLATLRFALHHAARHSMQRVIYVIPYTSIIDQNAQEVRSILEVEEPFGSVVLEHHSNLEPEKETGQSRKLAENWDSPIVFTTMVQFLEALFGRRTRDARRMHRLAGSVIIFDEIQTLPINCVHLFCNALNYLVDHCETSALLCTATQPLLGSLDNPCYGALRLGPQQEIVPDIQALFKALKRVEIIDLIKPGGWGAEEIAAKARALFLDTGSCLVVVNTKRWAKVLYGLCADAGLDKNSLFHLSTDMCPAHRMAVLKEMRKRLGKKPVLCISTQLIEAGVDVSFASVIRFVAGMDSIHQAAGRCNRHGELALGRVYIVNPDHESIGRLTDIAEGVQVTLRLLGEFRNDPDFYDGELMGPRVVERYFHYYFYRRQDEMRYPISEAGRDDTLLNLLSCNCLNSGTRSDKWVLRQSFATASRAFAPIDAPTQGVLVPYGKKEETVKEGKRIIGDLCAAFEPKRQRELLKKAQRYAVNVFPHVLRQLDGEGALHEIQETGIFYLDERYYSDEFGLSTGIVTPLETPLF